MKPGESNKIGGFAVIRIFRQAVKFAARESFNPAGLVERESGNLVGRESSRARMFNLVGRESSERECFDPVGRESSRAGSPAAL